MFCANCGANNPDQAEFCTQCGAKLNAEQQKATQQPVVENAAPKAAPVVDEENAVKRIHDNARLCAILWIVVGAFQCSSCVGIVAGVWNIVIGIRELKFAESIIPGNRAVYEYYDKAQTSMIIGAAINFVFGLLVGCALSVFECVIRDQVIKNKKVFGA